MCKEKKLEINEIEILEKEIEDTNRRLDEYRLLGLDIRQEAIDKTFQISRLENENTLLRDQVEYLNMQLKKLGWKRPL